jgi:hypothetical protein
MYLLLLAMLSFMVTSATAAWAQSPQRSMAWIHYWTPDNEAAKLVRLWQKHLEYKVRLLAGSLYVDDPLFREFGMISETGEITPTDQELINKWSDKTAFFITITVVGTPQEKSVLLSSRVFLGEAANIGQSGLASLEQKIEPSNASNKNDKILAATLYSLALEAKRLNKGTHITCGLLSQASAISQGIYSTSNLNRGGAANLPEDHFGMINGAIVSEYTASECGPTS